MYTEIHNDTEDYNILSGLSRVCKILRSEYMLRIKNTAIRYTKKSRYAIISILLENKFHLTISYRRKQYQ